MDIVRVAVISPVRIHLHGVTRLLRQEPGITVTGTAREPAMFDSADVILLDVAGARGIDTLRELSAMTAVPIVVLGIRDRPGEVVDYAEAGIAGYVTDEHTVDDLVAAVRSAHQGEFSCPASVAAGLAARLTLRAREHRRSPLSQLTARERQILTLIESGSSNKEIARRLHIQLTTVKNHVHNILRKLDVRGRGEAAATARRTLTG
jgi:two-component system, NarL family, nitrate/nitrite response regulator NarL